MKIQHLFFSFIFCESRDSHMECGNLLPPLMTEFIPSLGKVISRNEFREQGGNKFTRLKRRHRRPGFPHST